MEKQNIKELPALMERGRKDRDICSPQPKRKVILWVDKQLRFMETLKKIAERRKEKMLYGGADRSVLERLMKNYSQK